MVGKRAELRSVLRTCRERLTGGSLPLSVPRAQARPRPPDFGHFHVHGELFFQLSGRTIFTFPTSEVILKAGELLLVPALVTHAERAEGLGGDRFRNLVMYAGNGVFCLHLARSDPEERPVIDYIERLVSPRARAAAAYLSDAAAAAERAAASSDAGAAERGSAFLFRSTSVPPDAGDLPGAVAPAATLVRSLVAAALSEAELALEGAEDRAAVIPSASTDGKDRPFPHLVAECRTRVLATLTDADLSVARLAEWLGCASDYLSHLHKARTGESLSGFITRSRLERAEELLAETRLSVKEVSWACGFSSESYFIRKFKERYGETPAAMRRGT